MKKALIILLVMMLTASFGCGNKPQEDKGSTGTEAGAAKMIYLSDPVDGSKIGTVDEVKYSYVYKNIEYRFNSKKNYEAFKKDPEKYLSK